MNFIRIFDIARDEIVPHLYAACRIARVAKVTHSFSVRSVENQLLLRIFEVFIFVLSIVALISPWKFIVWYFHVWLSKYFFFILNVIFWQSVPFQYASALIHIWTLKKKNSINLEKFEQNVQGSLAVKVKHSVNSEHK